jgi:FkbM family methyltransferase
MATASGLFLQIGANDAAGADDRNYRAVLSASGWRKVLVEPVPAAVAALRRNTAGLPDVTIVDAAVSDATGSRMIMEFPDSRLSTLDARLAATARAGARGRQTRIRCVDGAALFAEAGIDRVDVLVIDTEGHDRVVLEQVLAHATPGAVVLEFGHLSAGDQTAVIDLLEVRGYTWCWAPLSLDLYAVIAQP